MFGLFLKDRAAEALKRGTKAVLIGGFFHVTDAAKFRLNEEASAYLYTEAEAHQIYILTCMFQSTLAKEKSWATSAFAIKAINDAATDYEIEHGISPGSISSYVFRRCAEIDNLSPQERHDNRSGREGCSNPRSVVRQRGRRPRFMRSIAREACWVRP